MAAIVNIPLGANTITYNGVQFGGSESQYSSTPPTYRVSSQFEYEESGRAVKRVKYTLSVSSIFYSSSQLGLATNLDSIREQLSVPGKELKIYGLGTGFDNIVNSGGVSQPLVGEVGWGPKPIACDWSPFGTIAWQCLWTVEFYLTECVEEGFNQYAWMAFNFDTTWVNDFEGMCERTISGYVEIVPRRGGLNNKYPQYIADSVRDTLFIYIPEGFRRTRNVWHENAAKDRLDFVITDEPERGTALPAGCIMADGQLAYSSQGPGFAKASVTLSMRLRISPSFPPSLAGVIFLSSANAKQLQMQLAVGEGGIVLPIQLNFSSGKFDRARETVASMTWETTKCLPSMLAAAGIWEPLPKNLTEQFNAEDWRASVQNLWTNRGVHGLRSNITETYIVDLCDNVQTGTIGVTPSEPGYVHQGLNYAFSCPEIPEHGGWITHDMKIRVLRKDEQTWHKKATSWLPPSGFSGNQADTLGDTVNTNSYTQQPTEAQAHDVEYNGFPETLVLLQFRGLRLIRLPPFPNLVTVNEFPTSLVEEHIEKPVIAWDALTCKVWFIRGYKIYRVNGQVGTLKATKSKTSCAANDDNTSGNYNV